MSLFAKVLYKSAKLWQNVTFEQHGLQNACVSTIAKQDQPGALVRTDNWAIVSSRLKLNHSWYKVHVMEIHVCPTQPGVFCIYVAVKNTRPSKSHMDFQSVYYLAITLALVTLPSNYFLLFAKTFWTFHYISNNAFGWGKLWTTFELTFIDVAANFHFMKKWYLCHYLKNSFFLRHFIPVMSCLDKNKESALTHSVVPNKWTCELTFLRRTSPL